MLPTRDSLQVQRHTQTEMQGMEKDIPYKWKSKESRSSHTLSVKINLKKNYYKRQRRTLHNDQEINP